MPLSRGVLDRDVSVGRETILLVEDDAFVRDVTGEVLESAGYVVLKAANAEQALQAYRQHPGTVHLLVTDLCMPGKNGRALAAELGSLCPELKTILISGYGEGAHNEDEDSGIVCFPKPFSAVSLMRKIRETLGDHEAGQWVTKAANAQALASR